MNGSIRGNILLRKELYRKMESGETQVEEMYKELARKIKKVN